MLHHKSYWINDRIKNKNSKFNPNSIAFHISLRKFPLSIALIYCLFVGFIYPNGHNPVSDIRLIFTSVRISYTITMANRIPDREKINQFRLYLDRREFFFFIITIIIDLVSDLIHHLLSVSLESIYCVWWAFSIRKCLCIMHSVLLHDHCYYLFEFWSLSLSRILFHSMEIVLTRALI